MRERIRQLVSSARRVTRTEPAEHISQSTPIVCAHDAEVLGAEVVRLARIAAALHMDQAATLRARVAGLNEGESAPSLPPAHGDMPVEVLR